MSNGNDTDLPAAQANPDASAGSSEPATSEKLTFTHPQPVDVDEAELTDAKSAAQAENAADATEASADATQATAEPTSTASAPTGQAAAPEPAKKPSGEVPMIPKPRLDEVLSKLAEKEQEAAYWRGVADARAASPAAATAQAAQPPTLEQRLAQLYAAQDALAEKFDAGEITMAEFTRQERELRQQEQQLREEQLAAKLKPAAATSQADELYLDTLTAKLEQEHPWVLPFNAVATQAEWDFVERQARENLTQRGIELRGSIGTFELRKEMSALIDRLAPALLADRADKAAQVGAPFPAQGGAANGQAQARLRAMQKASGAPPDLSSIKGAAPDGGMPSEQRIAAMSDEEIAAVLPPSVRQKLLGITS
jgi:hypothetical protein